MHEKNMRVKDAKKSMKTIAIYSLYSFENYFGELWGHDLDDSELTKEQMKLKEKWYNCRRDILDQEGRQARKADQSTNTVRNTIIFDVTGDKDGNR